MIHRHGPQWLSKRFEPKTFLLRHSRVVALLICSCWVVGCGSAPQSTDSEQPESLAEEARPIVASTTATLDFLVEYLAGEAVERRLVQPESGDPALGSPAAEKIVALQDVDLLLAHDADYEKWMATASLPASKLVWTAQELDLLETRGRTHSHGKEGEHSHTVTDPRSWMDPMLFLEQAQAVLQAIVQRWPELETDAQARLQQLEDELRKIDDELDDLLSSTNGEPLAVWATEPELHAYWARRFGLEVKRFHPDSSHGTASHGAAAHDDPGPDALLFITETVSAETLAANATAGLIVVQIDTLERPLNGSFNYLAQSEINVERLAAALQVSSQGQSE